MENRQKKFKNYFERRFDKRLRYFGSVIQVIFAFLWMPVAIYVPALTFEMVTGIDIDTVTPIMCTVCTFYTCIGGVKGVIWTDVLQAFIMFTTLIFVSIKGTLDVGGFGVIYKRNYDSGRWEAPNWTMDPTVRMGFFAIYIGGTLLKVNGMSVSQPFVQRFLSLPNMKAVKKTLIIFTVGIVLLLGLCMYIGLLSYAKYYDCDPMTTGLAKVKDQIVPLFVMQIAGKYPGIPGLFVSCVLSAALSSLSTSMNSLSAVILKDFIEPNRKTPLTERQTAIILRAVVLFAGLTSIVTSRFAKHLGLVMQFSSTLSSVSSGPILGIVTVGITLPFVKAKSVLTGCIIGTAIVSYMAIRAQIDIAKGEYSAIPKPVSVDGCDYDFSMHENRSTAFNSSNSDSSVRHQHVSFLCYTFFGAFITIIVSLIVTPCFGKQNTDEMDPRLVLPWGRKFLKRSKLRSHSQNHFNDRLHIDEENLRKGEYIVLKQVTNESECDQRNNSEKNYFELRFSRRLRLFGATLFIFKAIIWLPIAIYVPALTFSQVSGIDVHLITPIVIVICTFYTTVGGLKGVIWTDVVQSFIMYGTMVLLLIKGTMDVGGFDVIWQRNLEGGRLNIPPLTFDPTVRVSMSAVLIGGTIFKVQSTAINQPAVQRFMSLPSLAAIKQTMFLFLAGLVLLFSICFYVGLIAYATFHDCDPIKTGLVHRSDQLVPLLVMRTLGIFPGLPGLFVSAVFSAALSSLSTLLNSLSAVVLEDFIKPHVRKPLSERAVGFVMRSTVIIFGLSSIGLVYVVEHLGLVMQLSATLQSVLYGPMLGVFTMGMLMPWIKEKSALTGCALGFLSMCWICVNSQIAQVTGTFRHPKLPVSVEGCEYDFDMSHFKNSTININAHDGNALYHISFLWYAVLGAILAIVGANAAGLIFGFNNVHDVDENLLVPFVSRILKKRREYQQVSFKENIELSKSEKTKL